MSRRQSARQAGANPASTPKELQLADFWSGCKRLIVGFSGGCDSGVLLHLLSEYRDQGKLSMPLSAVHINHGLHADADQWQQHCQKFCAARQVPLSLYRVQISRSGASLEDRARTARYRAFEQHLQPGDLLALAHHADDQAETILMRLLRGSGPRGVAGIPGQRRLGSGELVRPLLDVPRQWLEDYARARSLPWVEDHSNADEQHDRNFIRHRVMPLLQQRWPSARTALLRAGHIAAETDRLGDKLADHYLSQVCDYRGVPQTKKLAQLSSFERTLLVRRWCDHCEVMPPPPSRLSQLETLCNAGADRAPQLRWRQPDGTQIVLRRYRGGLYLLRPLPVPSGRLPWNPVHQPVLRLEHGLLSARRGLGGLDIGAASQLEVRFRSGGEVCRPVGREGGRILGKYLQEMGVPPWERVGLPLLYSGNRLAAIGNLAVCEGFAASEDSEGLQIGWQSGAGLSSAAAF